MIDKIVIDPQIAITANVLAEKLNEVISVLSSGPVRHQAPPPPGPAQCVNYLETMTQRLQTGPYKQLSEAEPSTLTEAIGEALKQLQVAITEYKKSLVGATKTSATLEV